TKRNRTKKSEVRNLRLYVGKNLQLWRAFCVEFQEIVDIYKHIKLYNNADLSRVLQRIESTAVLEFACQEIGKESPETPLFTLHDCLVTTTEYIDRVDALFKSSIAEFIGVKPHTKTKWWSDDEAPVANDRWNEAA